MVNLNFSPPGIYEERGERPHTPVTLRERGVVGFVGLAQRGPMNTPVRVTEYERFRQIYGALDTPTYLESALKSFFENGGQECYVLRVAHMDPRRPGEVASAASARLPDREGRNTVLVEALNEGDWGNGISVEAFAPQQVPQTFLTLDLHEGQTSCTVKSTHGIERGTVLRAFDDDGKEEIFTVHAVSGHTVYFPEDQAATMDHPSSAPTYVEPVFFGMRVSYLGTDEVFDRVDLGEHSGHYVETVINGRSNLIRVRNLRSATDAPGDLPEPERKEVLEGGRDGMFAICPDDFIGMNQGPGSRYGLAAFEIIEDVDLLCVPDLMWAHENSSGFNSLMDVEVVQQALLSQCENLRDRFSILDIPAENSPARGNGRMRMPTSGARDRPAIHWRVCRWACSGGAVPAPPASSRATGAPRRRSSPTGSSTYRGSTTSLR